jgi:hypothetical protein
MKLVETLNYTKKKFYLRASGRFWNLFKILKIVQKAVEVLKMYQFGKGVIYISKNNLCKSIKTVIPVKKNWNLKIKIKMHCDKQKRH